MTIDYTQTTDTQTFIHDIKMEYNARLDGILISIISLGKFMHNNLIGVDSVELRIGNQGYRLQFNENGEINVPL